MLENIEVLHHSSIKIKKQNTIYIDPFEIKENFNDADIILITHSHFDHYSEEDIKKVKKQDTIILVPQDLKQKVLQVEFEPNQVIAVKPNESYKVKDIGITTIPAYNVNKKFHPKENNWVGYILEINGVKYFISGDTDINEENKKVKCDVAFLPVGGTYTMTYEEAANLANIINPKIAVPIHYGSIVGTKKDAENFVNLLNKTIQGKILMKM